MAADGVEAGAGDLWEQSFPSSVVARVIGVDQRRLRQLHDEGFIPQEEHGRYRLAAAVQGYVQFLKSRKPRESSEQSQLARAQREKVELQNRRQRGELLPREMVGETLQLVSAEVIAQIDGQASRLANELAGISDPAIVRERLQEDGRRIRGVVAEALERRARALAASHDAGGDVAPASEADAEPVGGGEQELPAGERGAGAVPQ